MAERPRMPFLEESAELAADLRKIVENGIDSEVTIEELRERFDARLEEHRKHASTDHAFRSGIGLQLLFELTTRYHSQLLTATLLLEPGVDHLRGAVPGRPGDDKEPSRVAEKDEPVLSERQIAAVRRAIFGDTSGDFTPPEGWRTRARAAADDGNRAAQLKLQLAEKLTAELDRLYAQLPADEQKLFGPGDVLVSASISNFAATSQLRSLLRG